MVPNFPSEWLAFTTNKEIKRLRQEISDTNKLRVQIAISVVIAVLSFYLEDEVSDWNPVGQWLFVVAVCVSVILTFLLPRFFAYCKLRRINNIVLDGRKATNLFDEEVVYDVMMAVEFFRHAHERGEEYLEKQLREFYLVEMTYYVKKSIESLKSMTAVNARLLGNKENQLSLKRVDNITAIIDNLLQSCDINDDLLLTAYESYKSSVDAARISR